MPPNTQLARNYEGPVFDPRSGNEDYFWYVTQPPAIAAAAAPQSSLIQIDADSRFLWIGTSYQADIAGAVLTEATNVIPLVTVQIQDGGSGKYLSNAPLPLAAVAGDGKRPYMLIGPRVFQKNSTINFNWAYVAAAAAASYTIRLVLHGIKLYD